VAATMLEVPEGITVLGSTEAEAEHALELCRSDPSTTRDDCKGNYWEETPQRQANIPRFWLDKFEVTVSEYEDCVEASHCTKPNSSAAFCEDNTFMLGLDDHPVNCVDWHQAIAYCDWRGKRLPNADEWEKAARGSDGQTFPWGEEALACEQVSRPYRGRCGDWTSSDSPTAPVGSVLLDRSPYDALDMAGNVSEWTATRHTDGFRVIKGGSLFSTLDGLRGARFRFGSEDAPDGLVGFRCAYSDDIKLDHDDQQ